MRGEIVAKMSEPNRYRVRVSMLAWYEAVVNARDGKEALALVENLTPVQIEASGRPLSCETLANRSGVG
jgi:hypothetical protein